jgi:CDP-diacylglycerol--serine O-phosphatidyltransferase
MKKHIPNFITCLNLFSGCIGTIFAFNGDLKTAAYFVVLSAVFDFFDGFVARLLNVKSDIGKELDSLADMISFGFLPGMVMFQLITQSMSEKVSDPILIEYLPYLAFFITVFSALRLAKFNIDTRQSIDFIGLNTPMNTLFIVSLPFIKQEYPTLMGSTVLLLGITFLMSYLLVGEFKLFSLKFNSMNLSLNKYRLLFLILSGLLILLLKFAAIPIVLVLYIGFSYFHFRSIPSS